MPTAYPSSDAYQGLPQLSEFNALIALLDDPDIEVQDAVFSRLKEIGRPAFAFLRQMDHKLEASVQERLTAFLEEAHFAEIKRAWHRLMASKYADLEQGAMIIANHRHANLDFVRYSRWLDETANRIRPRIEAAKGAGRAFVLASYLCDELGFRGNRSYYAEAEAGFLNNVIDQREGSPVLLSVLFIILARRLNLPIYGVNMPAHFLAKYQDPNSEVYFDVFNSGQSLTREQCEHSLIKAGIRPQAEFFAPATSQAILLRMMSAVRATIKDQVSAQFTEQLDALMAPWRHHAFPA